MRICLLANAASIHTRRWVKYFADKKHEVFLISHEPFRDNESIPGVTLFLLKRRGPQIKLLSALVYLFIDIIRIRKIIRKVKPDLLHGHQITWYGWLAVLSGFRPVLVSAWGSDILVTPKNSKLWKIIVKFTLDRASLILTNSQYLMEYLCVEFELPEHRVKLIPWGSDLKIFHKGYESEVKALKANLGIDDNSYVILSPRKFTEYYRIEQIVRAMPYIIAKNPDTILVLLKGGKKDIDFEARIDNIINELGIENNIRLIQQELSHKEMAVLYNASDVLVSIPKTDLFAISIQEGMACGVIPVVANLGVYQQYLTDGENAFIVDPQYPQQLAEKIMHCIEHPELRDGFNEINRKIIEENENWDKNMVKMEALYDSIVKKAGSV